MRLGIVSDTHGQVDYTQEALRLLETLDVDRLIHCGDIGSPRIVALLARWPADYVFGNVDTDRSALRAAIVEAGQTCHELFGELELDGRRIAFLHGDDDELLQQTINAGQYDLVCHGHTHCRILYQRGDTIVLNPGALYRARPHSFAIADLATMAIEHISV